MLFLLRIFSAMWALFWFHIKFKVVSFNSMKKVNGRLMGLALKLKITLGRIVIFTILIILSHEHGMFFHLFVFFHLSYFLEQWFVVLKEVLHIPCLLYYEWEFTHDLALCYWCRGRLVIFAH